MTLVIDIADAVAAELATGSFSLPFSPQRRVLPAFELADLAELRVTVVPKGLEISAASRLASQHEVQIDIGVQKKFAPEQKDLDVEVPALLELTQEIAAFLTRRPLAAAPHAQWVRTANEPIYAPEHLAEQRVFTSVLTVTYRALA